MTFVRKALRTAARIGIGSTFAILGGDAVREPGKRVELATPTLAVVRRVAPLPVTDEAVVRGNAAVQALAGVLLMLDVAPRSSALALAGSLVPTTIAGHGFWTIEDPAPRKLQQVQFCKNVSMLAGLLYVLADD